MEFKGSGVGGCALRSLALRDPVTRGKPCLNSDPKPAATQENGQFKLKTAPAGCCYAVFQKECHRHARLFLENPAFVCVTKQKTSTFQNYSNSEHVCLLKLVPLECK